MVHSIRPKLRTVATPTSTFSRLGTTLVGHPAIHRCRDQGCSRQNARRSEQAIKCSIVSPKGPFNRVLFAHLSAKTSIIFNTVSLFSASFLVSGDSGNGYRPSFSARAWSRAYLSRSLSRL